MLPLDRPPLTPDPPVPVDGGVSAEHRPSGVWGPGRNVRHREWTVGETIDFLTVEAQMTAPEIHRALRNVRVYLSLSTIHDRQGLALRRYHFLHHD